MPSPSTLTAVICLSAGLAGAWLQAPGHENRQELGASPVAALAWAQMRCDQTLALAEGTPRIQAEDLMRANAAFEMDATQRGTQAVCNDALAIAQRVADIGPSKRR